MTDADESGLWREVKDLLRSAAAIFGEPAGLLFDIVLRRADALALRAWIRSLEAVVRLLLLRMAARLPAPLAAPGRRAAARKRPKPPVPMTDHSGAAEPPSSELWAGVVFHAAPPGARTGCARRPSAPVRFLPVRALALRLEALIRVAESPGPYARRLARRLRAKPDLAPRLLTPPRDRNGRPPWQAELVTQAMSGAEEAAAAFRCSGAPPPLRRTRARNAPRSA